MLVCGSLGKRVCYKARQSFEDNALVISTPRFYPTRKVLCTACSGLAVPAV